jgi:hypothetical protein
LQHEGEQHWLPVVQGAPLLRHVVVDVVEDEVDVEEEVLDELVDELLGGRIGVWEKPVACAQPCP